MNPRVHTNRINRTGLDTISAVNAHSQVDVETNRILLDVGIGVFPGDNGDAFGRADRLAKHASHAAGRAVLADGETMATTEP